MHLLALLAAPLVAFAGPLPAPDLATLLLPNSESARFVLPVVPVPPAPSRDSLAERVRWAGGCPVRLTALICSQAAAQSLAVVQADGKSSVVRVGQTVWAQGRPFSVTGILPDALVLAHAAHSARCTLRQDISR